MRGMRPIRCASDGQVRIAAIVRDINFYPAHAGSVLGYLGQFIQETNEMISDRLALGESR